MPNQQAEKFITLPIKKIVQENSKVKTFYFDGNLGAKPGQFILFWLPGVDQKPFAISYQENNTTGITICRVGPFTEKVFKLKAGEQVGLQGPYGTFFKTGKKKNIVLVAGGYGAAPLAFLANENTDRDIDFIIGAKSKEKLIFLKKNENGKHHLHYCTEDGSFGFHGYVTEKLKEIIRDKKIDLVCSCGPELMQFEIVKICQQERIPCQISLERYIKCGIGLCGHCVVDPLGIRMCKEGPVISGKLARRILEFGKYYRDAMGRKINF